MARVLFPSEMYDLLEEFYLLKRDVSIDIYKEYKNMNLKILKIKKVHEILMNLYKIKSISWIESIN